MKYAMPQRKFSLDQDLDEEKDLAKKLFHQYATKQSKHTLAPFPLILFCYRKGQGFVGDDLGMSAKFCDEFFPTPTDHGICLTKNMDIKEVIRPKPNYDVLFEPTLQKSNHYVEGKTGTLGSQNIFAFFTGSKITGGRDSVESSEISGRKLLSIVLKRSNSISMSTMNLHMYTQTIISSNQFHPLH